MHSMKNSRVQLRLDKPCTQQWSEMTPSEQGRFCDSCQKNVVDFTEMTDNEILKFISDNQAGFCGQFRGSQLNRPFVHTQLNGGSKRLNSFLTGLAIAGAAGSLSAQSADTTSYHPTVVIDERHPTGPVCIKQKTPAADTSDLVLHITVIDTVEHYPMAFALVYLPGSNIGVQTDSAGKATMTIPYAMLGDSTLTVKAGSQGYLTQSVVVDTHKRTQELTIEFSIHHYPMLGGPMKIYEPETPKKSKQK